MTRAAEIIDIPVPADGGLRVRATADARWDARSYLLTRSEDAVIVDSNGHLAPPLADAARADARIHAVLLTHTHEDHVAGLDVATAAGIPIFAHRQAPGGLHGRDLVPGQLVDFGNLSVRALGLPGHDRTQIAYHVGGAVATGDSIYRHVVAGHDEPGEASYRAHMSAIVSLLELAPETRILPGHGDPTSVSEELEHNPFVRRFRDPENTSTIGPCRVGGPFGLWEAELELLIRDYDGGTKALVRFPTIGRTIIPGSQLYDLDGRPWTAGASTCCSTAPRT